MTTFTWVRESPLVDRQQGREKWILSRESQTFALEVDVRLGKEIDLESIKREWPYQRELELTKEKLAFFREHCRLMRVKQCPVCSAGVEHGNPKITVCGVKYLQCDRCTHVYATVFPEQKSAEAYYKETAVEDDYYINPKEIQLRLREIYFPKIEWMCEAYRRTFRRDPESVLDIGAGSGHFLFGCKKFGLRVDGIEFSRGFRKWCAEQFAIELHEDKKGLSGRTYDIVTSFNVIEHVLALREFVDDYKAFMHAHSLAVIETPKVNSLVTWVQRLFPEEPSGILVPYEHNHLFTDASLATLLFENGLGVKSVWYFGQDMAELIFRICTELDADSSKVFGRVFGGLQEAVDMHHASNLMLFAAAVRAPEERRDLEVSKCAR